MGVKQGRSLERLGRLANVKAEEGPLSLKKKEERGLSGGGCEGESKREVGFLDFGQREEEKVGLLFSF